MVAVSRCLVVTNSRKYVTKFSRRRNQIIIIILIWIYATVLHLPSDFEVKSTIANPSYILFKAQLKSNVDF